MKPSALALQEAVAEAYRTTPAVGSKALVERFRLKGWDVDNRAVKAAAKATKALTTEDQPTETPVTAESVQVLPATTVPVQPATVNQCTLVVNEASEDEEGDSEEEASEDEEGDSEEEEDEEEGEENTFDDEPVHECAHCGASGTHITEKCARCVTKKLVSTYYCNGACQKAHWPTHKKSHLAQDQRAADNALYAPLATASWGLVVDPALKLKMGRGVELSKAGDYRGAVKKFGKCLELPGGADSVSLHINLGIALKYSGEHASACKAYLHVVECAPDGSPQWAEGVVRAFLQFVDSRSKAVCAVVAKPTWWNEPDLMVISKKVVEIIAHGNSWRSAHLMRASVLSGCSGAFDRGNGPHNDPALYRESAQIFDTLADHSPPGSEALASHRKSAASMRAHALTIEAAYRMEENMRTMLRSAGIADNYRVLRGEYTGPGR